MVIHIHVCIHLREQMCVCDRKLGTEFAILLMHPTNETNCLMDRFGNTHCLQPPQVSPCNSVCYGGYKLKYCIHPPFSGIVDYKSMSSATGITVAFSSRRLKMCITYGVKVCSFVTLKCKPLAHMRRGLKWHALCLCHFAIMTVDRQTWDS